MNENMTVCPGCCRRNHKICDGARAWCECPCFDGSVTPEIMEAWRLIDAKFDLALVVVE